MKLLTHTDFQAGSEYGLGVTPTYRQHASGRLFGPHWLSNIDYPRLAFTFAGCTTTPNGDCIPLQTTYTDQNGAQYVYRYVG